MIELSTYSLEVLRNDKELNLYRGRSEYEDSQILVLSPAVEYPAPEVLKHGRGLLILPLRARDRSSSRLWPFTTGSWPCGRRIVLRILKIVLPWSPLRSRA
jgi:hypothetical protein